MTSLKDLNWGLPRSRQTLELCAWWCKFSAWTAQALVVNEPSRFPWTSGYRIWRDIAQKKTAQPTIHKASGLASHYSKIPHWDDNDAIGHQQTASGGFLQDELGTRTWESWEGKHVVFEGENLLELRPTQVQISSMCWKTLICTRRRCCRLRFFSPMHARQTPTCRALCKWRSSSRQSIEEHSPGDAGGTAGYVEHLEA